MTFRSLCALTIGLALATVIAACSSPTSAPTPSVTVVTLPTSVPSATRAPAKPTATLVIPPAPTIIPTVKPTPVPTAVPPRQTATRTPTVAPIVKRIVFSQNSNSALVHNVLPKNGSDQWVLRVQGGQTINVNLATENGKARLSIWGADGTVLVADQANASSWVGRVSSTQDYNIKVSAYDNTAPGYTLSITIPPR